MIIFFIPISFKKNIAQLEKLVLLGVFAILYTIIVICFETPFKYKDFMDKRAEGDEKYQGDINWYYFFQKNFNSNCLFFVNSANIIFSFDCQFALISVYDACKDKSLKTLKQLNLYGIIIITSIIIIIMVCGFFTDPLQYYKDLIIFRNALSYYDIFMNIGKILLFIVVISDICINFNTSRLSIFKFIFQKDKFSVKE